MFLNSIRYVAEDPNVDVVINYQPIDWITQEEIEFLGEGYTRYLARSYGRLVKKLNKPFIQLVPCIAIEKSTAEMFPSFIEILRQKGIPHFTSMKRLAIALTHLNEYVRFLKSHET